MLYKHAINYSIYVCRFYGNFLACLLVSCRCDEQYKYLVAFSQNLVYSSMRIWVPCKVFFKVLLEAFCSCHVLSTAARLCLLKTSSAKLRTICLFYSIT